MTKSNREMTEKKKKWLLCLLSIFKAMTQKYLKPQRIFEMVRSMKSTSFEIFGLSYQAM